MRAGVFAAAALAALIPGVALAGSPDALTFSANAVVLSDYRFRGTSYSEGGPVAQAMLVAAHESGVFGGLFVSSLSNHPVNGAVEVDLFVGLAKPLTPAITAEASVYYYYYPDANPAVPQTNSFETAAQLTGVFGAFTAKIGAWYAWKQATLGGRDNLYLFGDLMWRVPGTAFDAKVHAGYTHGAYSIAANRTSVDWSAGVGFRPAPNIRLGLEYVGIGGPRVKDFTDDTVVASLSVDF